MIQDSKFRINNRVYPVRYTALGATIVLLVWSAATVWSNGPSYPWPWPWLWLAGSVALALVGLRDITQTCSAVRRNYPIIGHIRFMLEKIRPEIRQYFIESDTEATPFSRSQRSLVYARAKGETD